MEGATVFMAAVHILISANVHEHRVSLVNKDKVHKAAFYINY